MVAERDEWDLMIFWPGLPTYIVTVYRDDKYIHVSTTRFRYLTTISEHSFRS